VPFDLSTSGGAPLDDAGAINLGAAPRLKNTAPRLTIAILPARNSIAVRNREPERIAGVDSDAIVGTVDTSVGLSTIVLRLRRCWQIDYRRRGDGHYGAVAGHEHNLPHLKGSDRLMDKKHNSIIQTHRNLVLCIPRQPVDGDHKAGGKR
jgi:hypothetical protein